MLQDPQTADSRGGTWLFVLPWELSAPGGVNEVVKNLFDFNERLLQSRSLLFINSWEDTAPRRELIDGRRTVHLRVRDPWIPNAKMKSLLGFIFARCELHRYLRELLNKERVLVVNLHYPGLTALGWALLPDVRSGHVKLALSFHGADQAAACGSRGVARFLWKRIFSSASTITTCSSTVSDELIRAFPGAANKTVVIDNGVDPEGILRDARLTPHPGRLGRYLLSLGTFEPKKGHDVTLRAFSLIADKYPDLHLVVAGRIGSGGSLDSLETLRRSMQGADRIHLLTDLDHATAMAWLRNASALVLSSRLEPFGIVALEAGVFRVPVVATNVCGVVHRLQPGCTIEVRRDDPQDLASGVMRLLDNPQLRSNLAEKLHSSVTRDFTWNEIARKFWSALTMPRPPAPNGS